MTHEWHDPDNDRTYYERRLPGPLPLRLTAWDNRRGGTWSWNVALLLGDSEYSIAPLPREPRGSADEAKAAAEAWAREALEKALGGVGGAPQWLDAPTGPGKWWMGAKNEEAQRVIIHDIRGNEILMGLGLAWVEVSPGVRWLPWAPVAVPPRTV